MFKMRELRGAGIVTVVHVPTELNEADIFTKILSRQTFEKHRRTILNVSGTATVTPPADVNEHDWGPDHDTPPPEAPPASREEPGTARMVAGSRGGSVPRAGAAGTADGAIG